MTTRGFHILVVDPDPRTVELFSTGFVRETTKSDWRFHFVESAEEALERMAENAHIELVVTEFDLPGMDGPELLSRIREQPSAPKTIMLTERDGLEAARTAMNRGALDFLAKPAAISDLRDTIERGRKQVEERRHIVGDRDLLVRLQAELTVAAEIQRSLLPGQNEQATMNGHVAIGARMTPAKHIGGDLYDYFALDDSEIVIAVGDVAGKGAPAALLMAVTQTLVRAYAPAGISPSEIVTRVNRHLCERRNSYLFVTLFLGIYETDTGVLRFTSAGHPLPLHMRPGLGIEELPPAGGMPVGVSAEAVYEDGTTTIAPGEGLFIYTDGLTEARGRDGTEFGEDRLRALLESGGGADPETLISRLYGVVEGFTAGAHSHDDITTLMLRRFA